MNPDLIPVAEFAARAAARLSTRPTPRNDREAFAAAYAILRDVDAAAAIADALLFEWSMARTMATLPDLQGDLVQVKGETLRRPAPFYSHGDYVFAAGQGQWYMAMDCARGMRWTQQEPFEANQQWFRQNAARDIERVAERMVSS